jgi:hypothetical protein
MIFCNRDSGLVKGKDAFVDAPAMPLCYPVGQVNFAVSREQAWRKPGFTIHPEGEHPWHDYPFRVNEEPASTGAGKRDAHQSTYAM